MSTLEDLVARAQDDPGFKRVCASLEAISAETWLTDRERAVLFAVGAYAPGDGVIVEIGSWKGVSASVLASGIAQRGRGRLTCVDPFAGGPPWIGLSPARSTLQAFRTTTQATGAARHLDTRVGDSVAVAASWPAQPLDAVLIDGDHSLIGALRDFESWAPKVAAGGIVLIDDADQPTLPGLLWLIEELKQIDGVTWLEAIDGMAAFHRDAGDPWAMLASLDQRMARRGLHRSRDSSALLSMSLPPTFQRSRQWTDLARDTAYELCFLARCGPGGYGYSRQTADDDRAILRALVADRADGEVCELPGPGACRVVLCGVEETAQLGGALQAGGVILVANEGREDRRLEIQQALDEAGFDGCGWQGHLHWGVRQPHLLSADAVLDRAIGALAEPAGDGRLVGDAIVMG